MVLLAALKLACSYRRSSSLAASNCSVWSSAWLCVDGWWGWSFGLHLLRPVLLKCRQLQLTSLSSTNALQPPLLCEGWGGRPLCLSGDSSVLMQLRWFCDRAVQCSILSIGSVSFVLLWVIFLSSLDIISSPLFQSSEVFHELVCHLAVVLPTSFFSLTKPFPYSLFFCLFRAKFQINYLKFSEFQNVYRFVCLFVCQLISWIFE